MRIQERKLGRLFLGLVVVLGSSCGLVKTNSDGAAKCSNNTAVPTSVSDAVSAIESLGSQQSCTTCHSVQGTTPVAWTQSGSSQVSTVLTLINLSEPLSSLLFVKAFDGHYGNSATPPSQNNWATAINNLVTLQQGGTIAVSSSCNAPTPTPSAPVLVGDGVFNPNTWLASQDISIPLAPPKYPLFQNVSIPLSSIKPELAGASLVIQVSTDATVPSLYDIWNLSITTSSSAIAVQGIAFVINDTVNLDEGLDDEVASALGQAHNSTLIDPRKILMTIQPTSDVIKVYFGSISAVAVSSTCNHLSTFVSTVYPIFSQPGNLLNQNNQTANTFCINCHTGTNPPAGLNYNTGNDALNCQTIKSLTNLSNPLQSPILLEPTQVPPHPLYLHPTPAFINAFVSWAQLEAAGN